ncbi:MAG: glutamate synthase large subunit [Candidatus Ancillula sp.]|jgi:glutamate synthase (NADPH/NADH) large chain|nr:glutamate synthase large subunit [Candidatus Ancillula sp.]
MTVASVKNKKTQDLGLYNSREEHDACGLAFVATLNKKPERSIVEQGLEALLRLDHRGAVGAEENTGDGAGILLSLPDEFLRAEFKKNGVDLPELGKYAVGIAFSAQDLNERNQQFNAFEELIKKEKLQIISSREVPVDFSELGPTAVKSMPHFEMFAVTLDDQVDYDSLANMYSDENHTCDSDQNTAQIGFERLLFRVRKQVQNQTGLYFASLSSRTITYKGMLTTRQLPSFYLDLKQSNFKAKIALVHSRFSTNTLPSWELAQPLRNIAHNGEINTVRGNRNWFNARQGVISSARLSGLNGGKLSDLYPILTDGASDSGSFDEVLELLHLAGRSLPHAVMMMVPQAWEKADDMDPKLKAFYQYTNALIEPWDGPASLSFTDGEIVGSVLDRNGLRPGRFWVTKDVVVMASEVGVLDIDQKDILRKGRLEPGKMLLVDTTEGRIIENDEIKNSLASGHPYEKWVKDNEIEFGHLPEREHIMYPSASVDKRQREFGYTEEEVKMILSPMAKTGSEPLGAMGTDTPIAVLSDRPRLLFDYFTQDFAQVTNPPLDSIREEIVTSIESAIGPEPNLLEDLESHAKKLTLDFPVINNDELAKIEKIDQDPNLKGYFKGAKIQGLFPVIDPEVSEAGELDENLRLKALEKRLEEIFEEVDSAIEDGANFIILSDRGGDQTHAPIPSLLLTSAVHHHLVRNLTRTKISLVVEAGDVRETHHVALLVSYGAACVNPYLAMETVESLARRGLLSDITYGTEAQEVDPYQAVQNLIKALGNGVLKIMSKMGISTIMSYRGSQIFGAVGLSQELIDKYFTGTTSKLGGIGIEDIARETLERHTLAYPKRPESRAYRKLRTGGEYKWRRTGEQHLFNPETIFYLQQSTQNNDYQQFKKYSSLIDDQAKKLMTIRGLMRIKSAQEIGRQEIGLDEVEPVESIMTRFSTGAMSYGSISIEAHETLAKAMNKIGARSNSGEGGEEIDRLYDPTRRSKIKQVASGRFGVTSEYLVTADDLQIKLAQGAKPGEGGHLPGTKVYPWIAKVRHSTPGIDLVSPPPHHDIYSIEDLAQLIRDLKMANPEARVHVKLVSEYGVGTIAAGVSKAKADVVLISGSDGGTGAAPLSSIKHAGQPWEIGLAETEQVLVQNDLRDRVVVQADGQLKTGRDVIIAALLGAEEFGFATAPLVVEGCVMMRVCNKNTCPVGIATQDPYLRKNFKGDPESVINFFRFIAEEVREYLAKLGFRTLEEAVGNVEALAKREDVIQIKGDKLDLDKILAVPANSLRRSAPTHQVKEQKHALETSLDAKLMDKINFDNLDSVSQTVKSEIVNVDRSVGALLGYEVTKRYNTKSGRFLKDDALQVELNGVGGQSLGLFMPKGITVRLVGETNDYAAKGLSGGKVIVKVPKEYSDNQKSKSAHESIIAGNVLGFGATSGIGYFAGVVGERFAVRNSGATFVVEGTGDHALEYMTGGIAVILGDTGRNVGAGFLGGEAYIIDLDPRKINKGAVESGNLDLTNVSDLPDQEQNILKNIISDFAKETESDFAKDILANWTKSVKRFSRLIPSKYRKIMEIGKTEEEWETNWEKIAAL